MTTDVLDYPGQEIRVNRAANRIHTLDSLCFHSDYAGYPINHEAQWLAQVDDHGAGGIIIGTVFKTEDPAQGDYGEQLTPQIG